MRKQLDHSDPIPTSKKIAEQTHVSEPTIKRDAQFARAIDDIRETEPEFVQNVLDERVPIPRKDVIEIAKIGPEENG
jgi:hypothetical protein